MTTSPHETLIRFGHPDTLVGERPHWAVLLRPKQVTAGALVLAARSDVRAWSDLPPDAFADLAPAVRTIERMLRAAFAYDRINYLMLMMVDPHVHFHVVPRYATTREAAGVVFDDPGWPAAPKLDHHTALTPEQRRALRDRLRAGWRDASAAERT